MRTQLSLFVPPPHDVLVESVRAVVDPVQRALIPAHVTLCREDELAAVPTEALRARLLAGAWQPVALQFAAPEAFSGHGILMRCIGGERAFDELREHVLGTRSIRRHEPHLTLAHPRNQKAAGNSPSSAQALATGLIATFAIVRWIEQVDTQPWRVVAEFHPR